MAGERIVVGVDGSDASKRALRWADHLATPLGASIDVLYSWEKPPPYVSPIADEEWDPAIGAEELLRQAVMDALGGAPASLRLITQEGSPVRALVDHSRLAYLLVVGSRGHGRVAGLVLGSVSARCVEQANCPVLVVHDSEPPDTAPA